MVFLLMLCLYNCNTCLDIYGMVYKNNIIENMTQQECISRYEDDKKRIVDYQNNNAKNTYHELLDENGISVDDIVDHNMKDKIGDYLNDYDNTLNNYRATFIQNIYSNECYDYLKDNSSNILLYDISYNDS